MARIVIVHGVGHQFSGEQVQLADWVPSLRSGIQLAGSSLDVADIASAFYGDLFRPPGVKAAGLPPCTAADLDPAVYEGLLLEMWDAAARTDAAIMPRNAQTKGPTWNGVQQALNWCCQSQFFTGVMKRTVYSSTSSTVTIFPSNVAASRVLQGQRAGLLLSGRDRS